MLSFWHSESEISKKRQNFNSRLLSMEVEAWLAPFVGYKKFVSCFRVCTSVKFNKKKSKKVYFGQFLMKKAVFWNIKPKF